MYEKLGYLNEKYRLFHINDRTDKNYEFHYHDFYKIIFFIKGDVLYNVEGKNYKLTPYDIVIVGKNEIHRPVVSGLSDYERYVLYISSELFKEDERYRICFDKASESHTNVIRTSSIDFGMILKLLLSAEERQSDNGILSDMYSQLDIYKILLIINESILKNGIEFQGNVQFNSKTIEICDYINNHLKENLSMNDLSNMFYMSKYYFMHQFKEQTGISVHQYVIEKRIQYTNLLVSKGWKISEACLEAGFNNYSTYLKASKKNLLKKEKD